MPTEDARVKVADMYMLADLLQFYSWSRFFRDDPVKVVKLSQVQNGQNRFLLIPGNHNGDLRNQLGAWRRRQPPRRKAPPPRWVDPIPVTAALGTNRHGELQEVQK